MQRPVVASLDASETITSEPIASEPTAAKPAAPGGSAPGLFPQDPAEYMDVRQHVPADAVNAARQAAEDHAQQPTEADAGEPTAATQNGEDGAASVSHAEQGGTQETGAQTRRLLARLPAGRMFVQGQETLPPGSLKRIGELAATMRLAPGERVLVVGHTDDVPLGPELQRLYGTNFGLSLARARQVRSLLVAGGVAPEAVGVAGVGNLHPLVPNTSMENRERNRRVDIWIVQENRQQARQ